ncbi:hypothetical protein ACWEGS_04635 [Streptomyces sp. NPDC004822]
MISVTELRLFADYFQIYVADAEGDGDLSEAWTAEAVADHLAVVEDALGVGTAVNVHVAVTVELLEGEPRDDRDEFDHVVEGSLRVASGRLVVMGCTDYGPDAATFSVAPGWHRVRVSRSNLARAIEADVESDASPETVERVRLQVWPEVARVVEVLKRWGV